MTEILVNGANNIVCNDEFTHARKKYKLSRLGYTILSENELPITSQQWEAIEKALPKLAYETTEVAESGEATKNVLFFRVKKSYQDEIFNEELWDILNSSNLLSLYTLITGLKTPFIDRAQVHIFSKGGYLERHLDHDVTQQYHFACILYLSDDYEGGEFEIYTNSNDPYPVKPKTRSLVITSCAIEHAIAPLLSGKRQTICCFVSEGRCTPEKAKATY